MAHNRIESVARQNLATDMTSRMCHSSRVPVTDSLSPVPVQTSFEICTTLAYEFVDFEGVE